MAKGIYIRKPPIERFHSKYEIDQETGCFNWTGHKIKEYGRLEINGKSIIAHRFSYETFVGPLDPKLEICHNCNNKSCVNPNHLRQDTRSSNHIDMSYVKSHSKQILLVEEVIEIKKALKHYYRGQIKDLAEFYKVNHRTISEIKNGNNWSHIKV
jgi:hypothetical protein